MKFGTILYYLLWPAIWFYAPLRLRVSVVIECDNELLEVKNWPGTNKWQLPGGGLKYGETVAACAKREAREELSIDVSDNATSVLTSTALTIKQHGLLVRTHVVLIHINEKPDITLSRELTECRWIDMEKSVVNEHVKSVIKQG